MVSPNHLPKRVLIVDDHPLMRDGLSMRLSLQPDLKVCGEAAGVDEAIALLAKTSPDLVLIDLALKDGHGLDLVKQIKSQHPSVKMLVISSYDESLYGERALRAGALGYLNKQESNEKLLDAVRTVLAGQRFASEKLFQQLLSQAVGTSPQAKSSVESLSNRELEIFQMIGQGLSTGVIADRLFISTHTIDTHRENIKRKLNISNAGELTRNAVQWVLERGESANAESGEMR